MPALSFRLPRFLHRSRRSDSAKPSPAGPRDEAAASHSPSLGPSLALPSLPPSTPSASEPAADDAIGTSRSAAPSKLTHPQNCGDRTQRESGAQPSQASRPVTSINMGDTRATPKVLLPDFHPAHDPDSADSTQSLHLSRLLAEPSQHSFVPERQHQPSGKDLPPTLNQNQGMFYQAHNLSATGNFIDGNVGSVTNHFNTSSNFMKDFLKETIPGAAADSSARDPPPRCHPGTRLAILERCIYFIVHCNGVKKMRWVFGAAGVGKSAVMQSVTESPQLIVASNASVFFSINGRSDGTKAFMTLSYQFAAKSDLYRRIIEDQVNRDPSLLQSSISVQFEKFITQPFIRNIDLNTAGRVLIIIDGLDECNDIRTQVELLRLISNFCILHPSSPIVWLIASRPEPHIVSFFSRPEVIPVYEKEEILVDSDEARADVERFLRHELTEIGKASNFLGPQWPDEQTLWKLASAANGLFAYAHTVIRYIGDSTVGDPISQLSDVLDVIDGLLLSDIPREQHPMALLDALYARILSNVPPKIMINARKLLLLLASNWDQALSGSSYRKNFNVMCNWLGMTADEAYAAVNRLQSILEFPPHREAHMKALKPFHKSLIDYMSRSWLFPDIKHEAQRIKTACAFRILKEAPNGFGCCFGDYTFFFGKLVRTAGAGDNIPITWPVDEAIHWDDNTTRFHLYMLAIGEVATGMDRGDSDFQSESCIKLLTTQFHEYYTNFPYRELRDFVYNKYRCREFMERGILKQIPAKAIDIFGISRPLYTKLEFHRPVAKTTLPDPWNSSCSSYHHRVGQWEQGKEQNWTTHFTRSSCTFCYERLKRHFEGWVSRYPDQAVWIMFASMQNSCVELRFVDPEDDVSEWTYWFWIRHSEEERKKLENSI